jgi:hypothetical protein
MKQSNRKRKIFLMINLKLSIIQIYKKVRRVLNSYNILPQRIIK